MFREPKIGDLDMTVSIEKKILRLQIPVDDILCMKIFYGKGHLSSIELCDRIRKALLDVSHHEPALHRLFTSEKEKLSDNMCIGLWMSDLAIYDRAVNGHHTLPVIFGAG